MSAEQTIGHGDWMPVKHPGFFACPQTGIINLPQGGQRDLATLATDVACGVCGQVHHYEADANLAAGLTYSQRHTLILWAAQAARS